MEVLIGRCSTPDPRCFSLGCTTVQQFSSCYKRSINKNVNPINGFISSQKTVSYLCTEYAEILPRIAPSLREYTTVYLVMSSPRIEIEDTCS